MKAMMLTGIRQMEMRDVPDPEIRGDTDVLIRMVAVGVCGSDVHYYLTGRIGDQIVKYPFWVGHESAGVVEKVGAAVTRVKPGDRIAIDPAMPCFECDQCRVGREHTCRKLRFLGCPGQAEGCLSELLVMPETSCYVLRDRMSFEQAALSEPLAIGVYAVKQSIPMDGVTVGILGVGPIGLSVMLPALARGAEKIYVTDKIDARLDFARKEGATWTGNVDKTDIVAGITAEEPLLLDVVFECCGQQDALDQAIRLLKPGGKLMIVGIPTVDRVSFDISDIRRKEICILNVRRQVHCVQPTLDMIDNDEIEVGNLVTHRFKFPEAQQAYDLVADYRDGVIKAMIHF